MNPDPEIEIAILRRLSSDNLNLAASFVSIGNLAATREHILAATRNLEALERAVAANVPLVPAFNPFTAIPIAVTTVSDS